MNENGFATIFECIESEAPTFTVDTGVNFVNFDAQNIPLRVSKLGALSFFEPKDNFIIEKLYVRFPDNFRLWDDNLVLKIGMYTAGDILVDFISSPDTEEIFIPLSDEIIPLNLYVPFPDASLFPAQTISKIKLLVDVIESELSMVNVPAALNEEVLKFYVGAVIRHTVELIP